MAWFLVFVAFVFIGLVSVGLYHWLHASEASERRRASGQDVEARRGRGKKKNAMDQWLENAQGEWHHPGIDPQKRPGDFLVAEEHFLSAKENVRRDIAWMDGDAVRDFSVLKAGGAKTGDAVTAMAVLWGTRYALLLAISGLAVGVGMLVAAFFLAKHGHVGWACLCGLASPAAFAASYLETREWLAEARDNLSQPGIVLLVAVLLITSLAGSILHWLF